ncbi:MAG: hypothetical protein JWO08_2779 [Verrucomicrobiaceae bacterium]|nr:hypothetical protein [Verrucomicrobiaceae bacterium]
MKFPAHSSISKSGGHSDLPSFQVVVLYEGDEAAMRAWKVLVWLERLLGGSLDLGSNIWSFGSLGQAGFRAASIREGTAADVIIVAAAEAEVLPDQVKRWLETCLASQHGEHALLIALHEDEPQNNVAPAALCGYLRPLASRWHTSFICNEELASRFTSDAALEKLRRK